MKLLVIALSSIFFLCSCYSTYEVELGPKITYVVNDQTGNNAVQIAHKLRELTICESSSVILAPNLLVKDYAQKEYFKTSLLQQSRLGNGEKTSGKKASILLAYEQDVIKSKPLNFTVDQRDLPTLNYFEELGVWANSNYVVLYEKRAKAWSVSLDNVAYVKEWRPVDIAKVVDSLICLDNDVRIAVLDLPAFPIEPDPLGSPSLPESSDCLSVTATVRTDSTGLNVRVLPLKSSRSIGLIQKGKRIEICKSDVSKLTTEDGLVGRWQVFMFNGQERYVFDGYLLYDVQ